MLYQRRKFDIRVFLLMTSINGLLKAYFYEEGYVRTASEEYSLKNINNRTVHLTNDAIQKKSENYGKYESGNKVSYTELGRHCQIEVSDIVARMKEIS